MSSPLFHVSCRPVSRSTGHLPFIVCATFLLGLWTFPGSANAATPAASAAQGARIVGASVQGETDLRARIRWDDGISTDQAVLLQLLDDQGLSVIGRWLTPQPGKTTSETLTHAFQDALSRGQHHELVLQDEEGTALSEGLPLQVRLACDGAQHCAFEVHTGISAAGMVSLSQEMAAALDEATATGAKDLLGHVRRNHPTLQGDAHSLAWQLRALQGQNLGASSEGCVCQWTVVVANVDNRCGNTCGGAHILFVSRGGTAFPTYGGTISGTTELTVDLDCWSLTEGSSQTLTLPEGSTLDVDEAGLTPCGIDCGGAVTYDGTFDAALFGDTLSAGDSTTISGEASFIVGGSTLFNLPSSLAVGGGLDDSEAVTASGSATGQPLGTTAAISSTATVEVHYTPFLPPFTLPGPSHGPVRDGRDEVGPDPVPRAYAEGFSDGSFRLDAFSTSACFPEQVFYTTVRSNLSLTEGPGTDDINLLVGKVDG